MFRLSCSAGLMAASFSCVLLSTFSVLPALAIPVPDQVVAQNIPTIPDDVQARVEQYRNVRSAGFVDWLDDGMLISTRFGETSQLHRVVFPGARREQMTFFKEPVDNGVVAPLNAKQIMFTKDVGGSEAYQIFRFDLQTGQTQMISDGKSRYGSPRWSNKGDKFVFSSTQRNQKDYDVYLASHKDPARFERIYTGQGYWTPGDWSPDDQRLLLYSYLSATRSQYLMLDLKSGQTEPVFPQLNQKVAFGSAFFAADGQGLYYTSDQSSEFKQVHFRDLKTGKMENLTPEIKWDVTEMELSHDGRYLAFVTNEDGLGKLRIMDVRTRKYLSLPAFPLGQVSSIYFSPDDQQLALNLSTSRAPSDVYTLNLDTLKLERWTHSEVGGLDTSQFPEAKLVHFPSFDKLQIPAFYFHPNQLKQANAKKAPVVIYIHGGPESQYRPGFSSRVQYWLNELGIAVIAPNVRGSEGYGKAYLNSDNGFQREDSVKDIGALLDWIKTQPQLDAERVAVYGGSYGGYMVLASLVHYSDRLKAGIDSVGISNFVTFLENTNPYRQDLRRVEYGDEREPKMREFLTRISPSNQASRIGRPLFVAQGLNDPRVPASEAEQIVKAVSEQGVPVWYMLAKDEGHGFAKKKNSDYYEYAMSLFWEQYLLK